MRSWLVRLFFGAPAALTLAVACAGVTKAQTTDEGKIYTLYRSSLVGGDMRVHVGTFDAEYEDETYNRENCFLAAALFQQQPGVTVKYWCERGKYEQ